MAAKGRGLFSLYIYRENFKNLLVRNHSTDFNIILQKCSFGDRSSTKIVQAIWIRQKTWPPGGGAYFLIYIYIENLKSLLVRNHWTDFHINLQKCSFGDPLPRLFKPFGFVKKHGRQGVGLIFPTYLYKKIFLSETTGQISISFCRNVPLVILFQDCSSHLDSLKNMAARGRGLFSLYIYIENLKKSSCRKPLG